VLIDEASTNAAFLTYMHNAYVDFNELLKIVPGVKVNQETEWDSKARGISVEDFPGGFTASFHLHQVRVNIECVPRSTRSAKSSWSAVPWVRRRH